MAEPNAVPVPFDGDSPKGFAFALTAYLLWGFLPFFMKALSHMSAGEVIAHRILWSVPVAGIILVALGRTADVKAALRSPRILVMAAVTATIITVNWGIYVWAITHDRAVETALGYYINPLFSIFLGAVLLKEKLSRTQKAAIGLAVVAVAVLAYDAGGLPWISVSLAFTWGIYAYMRKTLPVGPNQGFFLEVLILGLPALCYIVYLQATGQGHFGTTGTLDVVMLASCGLVTAIPLMIYANGAKLLRLSTIGIMQYIAPTMIFLIALFAFHEPFGPAKMVAFLFIWAALAIYTWGMVSASRARRRLADA
ncbi:EamA family transporter RarD [Ensifer soli]|uniref:EamA family transporter RarD n=1 Tax=Ciceribacter sp. sgz301302 TaxID=3342379 RepID=UPI0035B76C0B